MTVMITRLPFSDFTNPADLFAVYTAAELQDYLEPSWSVFNLDTFRERGSMKKATN